MNQITQQPSKVQAVLHNIDTNPVSFVFFIIVSLVLFCLLVKMVESIFNKITGRDKVLLKKREDLKRAKEEAEKTKKAEAEELKKTLLADFRHVQDRYDNLLAMASEFKNRVYIEYLSAHNSFIAYKEFARADHTSLDKLLLRLRDGYNNVANLFFIVRDSTVSHSGKVEVAQDFILYATNGILYEQGIETSYYLTQQGISAVNKFILKIEKFSTDSIFTEILNVMDDIMKNPFYTNSVKFKQDCLHDYYKVKLGNNADQEYINHESKKVYLKPNNFKKCVAL